MPKYQTADIRNIALVGHGAAGKTMLVETMLSKAKAVSRRGSVDDGTAVADFDAEEKERKHSIDLACAHLTWQGKEIDLLDGPGYPDFVGEAIAAMAAADAVLIAVDAAAGVKVNTRRVWEIAARRGLPRALVITRADTEHARWTERLDEIRSHFGEKCVPIVRPAGGAVGPKLGGVEVLFPLAAGAPAEAQALSKKLVEVAVESDEELMMRYLEGEELGPAEIRKALQAALRTGQIFPIFLASSQKDVGIDELLTAIADLFPHPGERKAQAADADSDADSDSGAAVEVDAAKPFTAQVFKAVYDPFVGKLAYFRVFSGSLPQNASVLASSAKGSIKVAHIYRPQGKDLQEIQEAIAGDIIAVTKIEDLHTGDTLMTADLRVRYPPIEFPQPMVSLAVEPRSRNDDAKLGPALQKLADSEPTIKVQRDPQTGQLVVSGVSDLHLQIFFSRLKRRSGVEVSTKIPKVPYRETITTRGDAKYRHKKQTGGAGQFAEVWMRIEPLPRGQGFEFDSEVYGGAISQSFIPSIEKGVRHVLEKGVIAGFTVVDVKAVVYDGKEHPVDSKDIAFQIAGRMAFKEAVKMAKPVLLEPIVDVEITVPQDGVGSIMSDLPSRRGRVTEQDQAGNYAIVKAQVPLAEMQTYSSELRSMTGGEGSYAMAFSHYEVVPSNVAQQVIAQYKGEEKEEE